MIVLRYEIVSHPLINTNTNLLGVLVTNHPHIKFKIILIYTTKMIFIKISSLAIRLIKNEILEMPGY